MLGDLEFEVGDKTARRMIGEVRRDVADRCGRATLVPLSVAELNYR